MIQHDGKGHQHEKKDESQIGKDLIGACRTVRISVKGGHEHHILIGQNDEYTQKEPHGKGRGKSFQYKGPQNAEK